MVFAVLFEYALGVKVEHLAAMLLIRKHFIASMEEAVPRLQNMRKKVNANPSLWGRNLWIMLENDAQRVLKEDGKYQGSPLGDLEVPGWASFSSHGKP